MNQSEPVDDEFVEDLYDTIVYHRINMLVAAFIFALNLLLFAVLLSNPTMYRKPKNQVLIILGMADTMNTISIFFMGWNRVALYTRVVNTHQIPVRTNWQCAMEPWLVLRGIGDVWPPIVQMIFVVQKCAAVFAPVWYFQHFKNGSIVLFASSLAVLAVSLLVGFVGVFLKESKKAKYYCGRKAAFGTDYATFIYAINILGYFLSFVINCVNLVKVYVTSNKRVRRQMKNVRYFLVISFLSFVLVSIPNAISLFSAHFEQAANFISKPSTWFSCANSGINIFVYLSLNPEFRQQFIALIYNRNPKAVLHTESDKSNGTSRQRTTPLVRVQ
ncbi:unnamed protein product [Caenorhabditis bovis]|uniref:G-protein coupled receptors family 1 profile domain-containing protein n=1 Tax=Caenorhabditis bovis TaxID=2654633 RepID=A0A8S1EZ14_9PELO|nr:unnamed protein product [Caenorhabditis bovis]